MDSMRFKGMGAALACALLAFGCGSDGKSSTASPQSGTGGSGAGGETGSGGSGTDANASKNGADGCPVKSGFPGDERCLPKPADSSHLLLHFGPSDYDDPAEVALYTVQPGDEIDKCFFTKLPITEDFVYGKRHGSMRPGSHHFIARAMAGLDVPTGFADCNGADGIGNADDIGTFQVPDYVYPPDAPDYAGLANTIQAGRQGMLNGHFINTTDSPTLAESWLEYEAMDPSEVTGSTSAVSLTGGVGMRIAPHTQTTLHFSCSPTVETRVLSLQSHMHAHGTRMTAWKVSGGVKTMIYEGFDWREPAGFNFDSVSQNPTPDETAKKPGAVSGPLVVKPAESIEWECAIDNTSDVTLTFRNQVNTGEMCILGGIAMNPAGGDSTPFSCVRN
ncbi:MAG TPA: hypothetical protein VHE30_04250 [Polyangiaceae bacterium]|nr:hypothetical protein [Polyangiaceae bacterium]